MAISPEHKAAEDLKKVAEEKAVQRKRLIEEKIAAWLASNGASPVISALEKQKIEREVDTAMAKEERAAAIAKLTGSEKTLKEAVSKISDSLAGGRFSFVATILDKVADLVIQLIPALKSLGPVIQNLRDTFNPNKIEKNHAMELVNEGKLEGASALLQQEELQLLKDMDQALQDVENVNGLENDPVGKLKEHRAEFATLEQHLEELAPLKSDKNKKDDLKALLETIRGDLKNISEHHATLKSVVEAADGSLKSLPVIFKRMEPILAAHEALYKKEAEQQAKGTGAAAP